MEWPSLSKLTTFQCAFFIREKLHVHPSIPTLGTRCLAWKATDLLISMYWVQKNITTHEVTYLCHFNNGHDHRGIMLTAYAPPLLSLLTTEL
jgi:hypothetical protein